MKPKLIIRLVLGVVLVVLVVLALLDFKAKGQATDTAQAWQNLMDDVVLRSDLGVHIQGSPDSQRVDGETPGSQVIQYTWPGTLRSYRVDVTMSDLVTDDDPTVMRIDGPIND